MAVKAKSLYIVLGSVIIAGICIAVFFLLPNPTRTQYTVLAIVLSLGGGAFAFALPGLLEFNWADLVKAGGALGVLALIIYVMFVLSPFTPIQPTRITGWFQLKTNPGKVSMLSDLYLAIIPPDVQKYENGKFIITNVPCDKERNAPPNLVIIKKGYEPACAVIEENSKVTDRMKYLVSKRGNEFLIDESTPVMLEIETPSAGVVPYSAATGNVAIPTVGQ